MSKEAYKDHRAGTIKGEAHRIFDTKGRDAALKYVEKEGLKDSTGKVWTSTWAREGKKGSARRAPAAAAKAKPARKAAVKGKTAAAKRPARAKAKATAAKAE